VNAPEPRPRVAVFAPHPLLTVTLERTGEGRDQVHFHTGGQGVWVAHMIASMGAEPVLCAFLGGESGELLLPLLEGLGGERRLVPAATASCCYVIDRRSVERRVLASALSDPPMQDELDELFSLACAEAVSCGWLVITNPLPAESLPLELYRDLVADARASGCRTIVDLSSPRLDSALRGGPDLVKLNDWELAEFVDGPVSEPGQLHAAISDLREGGARAVVLTRGEKPALLLDGENAYEVTPPRLEHGFREGCGDAMLGALAGTWARGDSLQHAVVVGAAAGAANFLRHDLGSASRAAVDKLTGSVTLSATAL